VLFIDVTTYLTLLFYRSKHMHIDWRVVSIKIGGAVRNHLELISFLEVNQYEAKYEVVLELRTNTLPELLQFEGASEEEEYKCLVQRRTHKFSSGPDTEHTVLFQPTPSVHNHLFFTLLEVANNVREYLIGILPGDAAKVLGFLSNKNLSEEIRVDLAELDLYSALLQRIGYDPMRGPLIPNYKELVCLLVDLEKYLTNLGKWADQLK
jgi:hypothetical protein